MFILGINMIKRSTALQSLITRGTPLTDQNGNFKFKNMAIIKCH